MKLRVYISLAVLFGTNHHALSSCGAASCPLNSFHTLAHGSLQIGYRHEYINQDQVYVGSTKAFVGAITQHHDEVQTINSSNVIQISYGIVERLSFDVDVPFISREHSHIHHHQGQDVWESWNFSGLADMIISGHLAILVPSSEFTPHLSLIAGVKLRTGVTHAKNAEGEEAEVAIQPGSGSTDGILGVNFRQTLFSVPTLSGEYSALPFVAGATYQSNSTGTDGWRFGNTLVASIGTSYQFTRRTSLLLQLNGRFQGFADVGTTGEPRENTGGTWIFASPGLSVQLNDAFAAYSYVQFPVYQNVHGIQQTARLNLRFGIEASVNLLE
jgi:hypothetical protein